ncbi:hypothetical protein C8A03DRAFT_35210 [Achaetomium macrosporum]|uniref:Uncharacterized protein n=1 Tax=Achaetomium macrosporum TaxID=79813 RepID=A0AAN7C7G9_9PEZI|nr:hypothetical protein C8A03DRAFT_35210 [Achaetomium macrosporum]
MSQLKDIEAKLRTSEDRARRLEEKYHIRKTHLNSAIQEQQDLYTRSKKHRGEAIEQGRAMERLQTTEAETTVRKAEAIREQMMEKARQAIAHSKSEALERKNWKLSSSAESLVFLKKPPSRLAATTQIIAFSVASSSITALPAIQQDHYWFFNHRFVRHCLLQRSSIYHCFNGETLRSAWRTALSRRFRSREVMAPTIKDIDSVTGSDSLDAKIQRILIRLRDEVDADTSTLGGFPDIEILPEITGENARPKTMRKRQPPRDQDEPSEPQNKRRRTGNKERRS